METKTNNIAGSFTKTPLGKETVTEDGIRYERVLREKEGEIYVRICGAAEGTTVIDIPATLEGNPVEIIRKGAFAGNEEIVEVSIPQGIKLIGAEAFKNCINLEKVELPSDLEVINRSCFEGCVNLHDINIPYSIKNICINAFKDCVLLDKALVCNENVAITKGSAEKEEIDNIKMNGNEFTENGIVYSFSLNKRKKPVFVNVKGIVSNKRNIVIPSKVHNLNVEVIKRGAFEENSVLARISLPDTIRVIGADAFRLCTSLKRIDLPADLEVINEGTFEGCTSLERVALPHELKRIGKNAFNGCTKLRSLFHYVKTGVGSKASVDKSVREKKLPSGLERIGAGAFQDCQRIRQVYLPVGVTDISEDAFRGCEELERVELHSKTKKILSGAFLGCSGLKEVRLPNNLRKLAEDAFEPEVTFICNDILMENLEDLKQRQNVVTVPTVCMEVDSTMIPGSTERFYSDEALLSALDSYEIRTPMRRKVVHSDGEFTIEQPSRYTLKDGVYCRNTGSDTAKILLTGDMMCRGKQIKNAFRKEDGFIFDEWHQYVKPILEGGDLVVGSMETMLAQTFPYSNKVVYNEEKVYLNAPDAFAASIKNAGFDLVVNAHEHVYDTGLQGIFETLDVLNRAQLMHTGLFAGANEKKYTLLEVNGIRIGVVAYFDHRRQQDKRANYTRAGLNTLFSAFIEEQVKEDIKAAKEAGAEFILAYSHCGRENKHSIIDRQEKLAQMLADAGADFVFGCHSHCLQPYRELQAEDGRTVPVLYSGGNFISDMKSKVANVRDTLIGELVLHRDENGAVKICSSGYHPCFIKYQRDVRGKMITTPAALILASGDETEREIVQLGVDRIAEKLENPSYECIIDTSIAEKVQWNVTEEDEKEDDEPLEVEADEELDDEEDAN